MEFERIEKISVERFIVSSESTVGAYYLVTFDGDNYTCSCPQQQKRNVACKHIGVVDG